MGKISDSFLDSTLYRRALSRWVTAAREARGAPLGILRRQSRQARDLRTHLNQLIHIADDRLSRPAIGSESFPKPHNADWAWRPGTWRDALPECGIVAEQSGEKLGTEIALFHDCPRSEITLRQRRNRRDDDLAAFGLQMDVFGFEGSFLSLVLDLPSTALQGLTSAHILRADCLIDTEKPLEVFVRLNLQQGPNSEQMVREFPAGEGQISADFDLAYAQVKERPIDKAWVDLIFENPRMNQIMLRDLTFCRHPRAQV
jgi:hypothetical protein